MQSAAPRSTIAWRREWNERIDHRDGVITRPDSQLDDREMKVFDHKAKVHREVDWPSTDRSFSRIEKPMLQKAGGSWRVGGGCDHIIPERTSISDQGHIGSCVANSAHQLRKIGIVDEKWLPYKDTRSITSPSSSKRLKEIELAIRADHPVVFGAPVSQAFTEARGMDVFTPPSKHDTTAWYAMIIVGVVYDHGVRRWLLRNSWGKRWGENGHIEVTDDYVQQFRGVVGRYSDGRAELGAVDIQRSGADSHQ